jgi:hypothetical protein
MLPEALDKVVRQSLLKIHTAFPGTIIDYDDESLTATVESGFEYVVTEIKPDGTRETSARKYPLIKDVPVSLPVFGKFQIRPPASEMPGATVLLVTSERALDNFMESGRTGDPEEPRIMEISDAIIISGLATENKLPSRKSGINSLEISYGDSFFEITEQGKFKIQSGSNELLTILADFLKDMQSGQVTDPSSGLLDFTAKTKKAFKNTENKIRQMKGG